MAIRTPVMPTRVTGQQPCSSPRVWNKYLSNAPANAVYIGRGSQWGNPYVIGVHGTRAEVLQQFEQLVVNSAPLIDTIKRELKGKRLLCFCSPLACHGDLLLRIANED